MRFCIHLTACLAFALLGAGARADTLKLDNGDSLSGEIVEERDDAIVLEHPVLGRVEVPRERLFVEPPPNPGVFGTGFMEGWTREANAGLFGSEGNTVNANVTAGFDLKAENDERRWTWIGRYFVKMEEVDKQVPDGMMGFVTVRERELTEHNARVETRYDWILSESRWFLFLHPAYDFDDFKSWKHRVTVSGGPGYDLVKSEPFDLRSSLGLSFQREFKGEKTSRLSAVWGVNTEWRIAENHSLTARNQLFPTLINDPGDFRNLTSVAWKIRLSKAPALNLNLGVENEYESYAPPEDEKNDLKYYGTLGVEF